MKRFLIPALLILVPGCVTPEEAAENRRLQVAADEQTCASYGLRPQTEAFGNCRLQLDLERQREYNDYRNDYYNRPPIGMGFGYYHYR